MLKHLLAIENVRRMPGGSQSQLMRVEDGNYYVVKFPNNPQGVRILANEMMGASLASLLGIPAAKVAIIQVGRALIRDSDDMTIQFAHHSEACQAGLCFGSLFSTNRREFVPSSLPTAQLENLADFLGMLIFDKWTYNNDWRQVVFNVIKTAPLCRATMIDQGNCFGGNEWTFRDEPLQGFCHYRSVYQQVQKMQDFQPWLVPLEQRIDHEVLRRIGDLVPPEWYRRDSESLLRLLFRLDQRRARVRSLLDSSLHVCRDIFPNVILEESHGTRTTAGKSPLQKSASA